MQTTFNAVTMAKEIMTALTSIKVSTGVKVEIGKKGGELRIIELKQAFTGYDAVRKSVNRQTEKFYDEDCIIKIGDKSLTFKGGKFSNELLKMLERCTTEFFNGGDHMNADDNFKYNLAVVKLAFLNNSITIVDLLPIAAQFSGLNKKQLALLGGALANHETFQKHLQDVLDGIKLLQEQKQAELLEIENNG
jgi:hypothetical protein